MLKPDDTIGRPTAWQWRVALAQYGGACPVCRRPLRVFEDEHGAGATGCADVPDLQELIVDAIADGRL